MRLWNSLALGFGLFAAPAAAQDQALRGAPTPDSLARLLGAVFESATPEAFDSVYTDPAGRAVFHSAVKAKSARHSVLAQVIRRSSTEAVLLFGGIVAGGSGSDETNRVRHLSSFYEARLVDGMWRLGRKIPIDSSNYIRRQALDVDLAPERGIAVVDTLTLEIGGRYGFAARLNNVAQLERVELNGRVVPYQFGGGLLWVDASPQRRARLVLRYGIDAARGVEGGGPDSTGKPVTKGAFHNTDGWQPFFEYTSGHDISPSSIRVRLPAEYRLSTSLPQTESVRNGVRTVVGITTAPQYLIGLAYNRDWQVQKSRVGTLEFETFLTPSARFQHDTLAKAVRRVYEILVPRFGEPATQAHYLSVVEDQTLGKRGFLVRMNSAVVSGGEVRSLETTGLTPTATFAHEVSHGWTFNATGPAANFLREGWARFAEATVIRAEHGPEMETAFAERLRNGYFLVSDGKWSILGNPDNGSGHYNKGLWILRMLNRVLGDSVFDRGMRGFMTHVDGRAGYREFIAELSRAAGRDLTTFIMPWLAEKVVPDLEARADGGKVIVTQRQPGTVFELPVELLLTTDAGPVRRRVQVHQRVDTLDVGLTGIREIHIDPDREFLLRRSWGETARFVLEAPEAKEVTLGGDFSLEPVTAVRTGSTWSVELPLSEGRYTWAWKVDGAGPNPFEPPADDSIRAGVRVVRPLELLSAPKP
jgi:hypothetical protein